MSDTTPPPNPYPTAAAMSPEDQRLWATLVHVGGIFFSFVPALIAYLVLKDRGAFIRQHTATAFNFHLTMLLAQFALVIVVGIIALITFGIGGVLYILNYALGIFAVVMSIIAAVKANKGQPYTYPLSIKFFS